MKYFKLLTILALFTSCAHKESFHSVPKTSYHHEIIRGKKIFYREAGKENKTTLILLHGYPSSSHTYRELIPLLSPYFHIIAPDYLGSGYSEKPNPQEFTYTFDKLADYTHGLIQKLKITNYVLYMQDFGAPVGFRIMMKAPEQVRAIISQNANAYLDGLVKKRQAFFLKANRDRSSQHVKRMENWVKRKAIIHGQYLRDVPKNKHSFISPDSWTHDLHFLQTPLQRQIQVQLFQDYQNNINQYPKWQKLMREHQYPALIAWGKEDIAFIADGAKAYLKDLPSAKLELLDAGHFAVEERPSQLANLIYNFLIDLPPKK